jgi:hypothetical protein
MVEKYDQIISTNIKHNNKQQATTTQHDEEISILVLWAQTRRKENATFVFFLK